MERSNELTARLAANRFRLDRADFADGLARLLGRASPEPLADAARAAALSDDFRAAHDAAMPHDWALVTHAWGATEEAALTDALHRLARNLGARPSWLFAQAGAPQAAALTSDAALDNPLGFAAAAGHQLALLDRELPAGLWLVRHSHHYGAADVRFTWELEVFGEPWLSAATQALRGVGYPRVAAV